MSIFGYYPRLIAYCFCVITWKSVSGDPGNPRFGNHNPRGPNGPNVGPHFGNHNPQGPNGLNNVHNPHPPVDDLRIHLNRDGIVNFVIHRGCMYMSGFLRSHYVKDTEDDKRSIGPQNRPQNSGSACQWQQFVGNMCNVFHIPPELRDALIDCGMKFSFDLFSSQHDTLNMVHVCNFSIGDPTSAFIGKRNEVVVVSGTNRNSTIIRDTSTRNNGGGKNDDDDDDKNDDGANDISIATQHYIDTYGNTTALPLFLKAWCQSFSRKIRSSYHFSSKNYIKTSRYWILDVYKVVNKYRMPKYIGHSLVGCGLKYSMYALNVPFWQTLAYLLRLK